MELDLISVMLWIVIDPTADGSPDTVFPTVILGFYSCVTDAECTVGRSCTGLQSSLVSGLVLRRCSDKVWGSHILGVCKNISELRPRPCGGWSTAFGWRGWLPVLVPPLLGTHFGPDQGGVIFSPYSWISKGSSGISRGLLHGHRATIPLLVQL
jgi:hypothetical protein